jgi:hypothetical protein
VEAGVGSRAGVGEMLQQELLTQVLEVLHLEKITYMITGSLVSSMQGEPRTKHDIDMLCPTMCCYEV